MVHDDITRIAHLERELKEAYEDEGNRARITWPEWLSAMANNPRGTLQDAAHQLTALGANRRFAP
jgi:hypothetical protein